MKTQEEIELELNLVIRKINNLENQLQLFDEESESYKMLDRILRGLFEKQLTLEWVLTETIEL